MSYCKSRPLTNKKANIKTHKSQFKGYTKTRSDIMEIKRESYLEQLKMRWLHVV